MRALPRTLLDAVAGVRIDDRFVLAGIKLASTIAREVGDVVGVT
jgi:hypothetical protein